MTPSLPKRASPPKRGEKKNISNKIDNIFKKSLHILILPLGEERQQG
jgi:hypothetical protein